MKEIIKQKNKKIKRSFACAANNIKDKARRVTKKQRLRNQEQK
jgi:hypothetical protein